MLIRSQDKEILIDFGNTSAIEITGASVVTTRNNVGWCCILGRYSNNEKCLKVLDMIQEAYADAELIQMTVSNIGKMFAEAPASKENELLAETIGEALMKKMVFQMPEDSEVEV